MPFAFPVAPDEHSGPLLVAAQALHWIKAETSYKNTSTNPCGKEIKNSYTTSNST